MTDPIAPLVVLTVTLRARHDDPALATRKNERYAEAIARHGGRPLFLDESATPVERERAFDEMDGLLLTGGADIDPARYSRPNLGSVCIEAERDALEAAAWAAAGERGVPVLGVCRGFQAINVFSGGTLIQHVAGHAGPGWTAGPAKMHPVRIEPASVLGRALQDGGDSPSGELSVNTYHHQGVGPDDLAPELLPTAWAAGPDGDLIEAAELPGERFVVGVQCHPERTEFSPAGFERLWAAFVDACRVPARA